MLENIYMQNEDKVYKQLVRIPMDTICTAHSRFVIIWLREGFYV